MNELDTRDYRPAHPPFWPGDESGYDEYHRQMYGLSDATSAFSRWKILSTGINIARQLAGARNLGRAVWEADHGGNPAEWPLPHPPAVLWMPYMGTAACLACLWIGASSSDVGQAASEARRHAASFLPPGSPALLLLLEPLPVWHREVSRTDVEAPTTAG